MQIHTKNEVLPEEQLQLWNEFNSISDEFVLYGGTAVALRYGHRTSIDFDFFTFNRSFDLDNVKKFSIFTKYKYQTETRLSTQHHYIFSVNSADINVSFINYADLLPAYINQPDICKDNGVQIASPLDLMAAKILAINGRSAIKDFVDIGVLLQNKINLEQGFAAALSISKHSEMASKKLNLSATKEDIKSKPFTTFYNKEIGKINFLQADTNLLELLQESAKNVNIDKVYKKKIASYR